MERKKFIKSVLAAAAVPALNIFPSVPEFKKTIKPPALKKGDTIGLITPGSYISESELADCIKNLELLGLKPFFTGNILKQNGYFSAVDSERVEDLHLMFNDENVKGIMCARGGFGCARLLPYLDYDLIKNNPKVLIGYSDVTALLYGIYVKTGLITFHGPVGISSFNSFTQKYLNDVLFNPEDGLNLVSEPEEDKKPYVISKGKAEGVLAGGNLTVVTTLIGTPYDIDLSRKILFLEEIAEEPYRIDRMLTQLLQAGKLTNVRGIALGVFKDCEPKKINPSFEKSFSLSQVLHERLGNLNIPVIYGLSFGHVKNKFTLPLGITGELNTFTNTIRLLETSVE